MKAQDETKVEIVLAPTEDAVPAALAALDVLEERLGAEELQDARLLVVELVSNAVRHAGLYAGGEVSLGVKASPKVVRGEVCDPGTKGFEPPRPVPVPGPYRASGWGLYIVERISDRWGVEEREGLGCAWFEFDRPRGAAARRAYRGELRELSGRLSASVREEAGGRVLVVEASGDVHFATREVLHGALEEAAPRTGAHAPRPVVVDLSAVGFFDSGGVGVLIGATGRLRERGGEVRVVADKGPCSRVLGVTGLDRFFRVHADLPSALKEAAKGA